MAASGEEGLVLIARERVRDGNKGPQERGTGLRTGKRKEKGRHPEAEGKGGRSKQGGPVPGQEPCQMIS